MNPKIRTYVKAVLTMAFLICFCTNQTFAQKKSEPVIVLDGGQGRANRGEEYKTAIKLGLSEGLSRSAYALFVERSITSLIAIEVGGGVTYNFRIGNIQILNGFVNQPVETDESSGITVPLNDIFAFGDRISKPGYFLSVSPRVYFKNAFLEDYYVGVQSQVKQYNFMSRTLFDGEYSSDYAEKEEFRTVSGMLVIGKSIVFTNVVLDFNIAGGFQKVNTSQYISYNIEEAGRFNYSSLKPALGFSVKLGGIF
jgi:hypothetical protein